MRTTQALFHTVFFDSLTFGTRFKKYPVLSMIVFTAIYICLSTIVFAKSITQTSDADQTDRSQIWEAVTLSPDMRFTGLDISPDGQRLAMTVGPEVKARIIVVPRAGAGNRHEISLPKNVIPYDPDFDATGRKILFAGYCHPHISDCHETTIGWNIFVHDLESGKTEQITTPYPALVRWRPAWGPDGAAYFVGFRDRKKLYLDALIAASAVFRVNADGTIEDIFPNGSMVGDKSYAYISHPRGQFNNLSIVAVRRNELVLKAHMSVRPKRPQFIDKVPDPHRLNADQRITKRVEESFLREDQRQTYRRNSSNTLFVVTETDLEILYEREALTDKLPPRLGLKVVAADDETIWFPRQLPRPNYGYQLNAIKGDSVSSRGERFSIPGALIVFGVGGETAVMVERRRDETLRLFTFIDWNIVSESVLQPRKE